MSKFWNKIKELIFPRGIKCEICGKEIEKTKGKCLCDDCFKKLPFILHGCTKCGEKIVGDYSVCYNCKNNFREFDKVYSVFEYDSVAKEMVWNLKYENKKYLARTMASFLTDCIAQNNIKFDVLSFVPVSVKTYKKRGYNQARLLAEEVGANLKIEATSTLIRIKENISQVELSASKRAKNIDASFLVKDRNLVRGKVILVVDDVLTTGATLNEIAKMLKKAGAKQVFGLTFANTTRKIKFENENEQIPTKCEK